MPLLSLKTEAGIPSASTSDSRDSSGPDNLDCIFLYTKALFEFRAALRTGDFCISLVTEIGSCGQLFRTAKDSKVGVLKRVKFLGHLLSRFDHKKI